VSYLCIYQDIGGDAVIANGSKKIKIKLHSQAWLDLMQLTAFD